MKRTRDSIVLAHVMDPERRELYVEGNKDRTFLNWLTNEGRGPETTIHEIGTVEAPNNIAGGEKGRLLDFAIWISDKKVKIRFFSDADNDRIVDRAAPRLVWLTDPRDLEGYLLRSESFNKLLSLSLSDDTINSDLLLRTIMCEARRIGILRVLSEMQDLSLPFKNTTNTRYISIQGGLPKVNIEQLLRILLQNASIGLGNIKDLMNDYNELEEKLRDQDESQLIQGKDALDILDKALKSKGLKSGDSSKILWASYEKRWATDQPNLSEVISYLEGNIA